MVMTAPKQVMMSLTIRDQAMRYAGHMPFLRATRGVLKNRIDPFASCNLSMTACRDD
jgi:Tfp pilus assembly protein PilZ